jgi:hypothetical protein
MFLRGIHNPEPETTQSPNTPAQVAPQQRLSSVLQTKVHYSELAYLDGLLLNKVGHVVGEVKDLASGELEVAGDEEAEAVPPHHHPACVVGGAPLLRMRAKSQNTVHPSCACAQKSEYGAPLLRMRSKVRIRCTPPAHALKSQNTAHPSCACAQKSEYGAPLLRMRSKVRIRRTPPAHALKSQNTAHPSCACAQKAEYSAPLLRMR